MSHCWFRPVKIHQLKTELHKPCNIHQGETDMCDALLLDDRCYNKTESQSIFVNEGFDFKPLIPKTISSIIVRYKWLILLSISLLSSIMRSWTGWITVMIYIPFCWLTWWICKAYFYTLLSCKKSKKLQISIYCLVPWRILSRCWGKLAAIYIPKFARFYVFMLYSKLFCVNIDEVQYPLDHYPTLTAFFTRKLKTECRIVDTSSCLVSPCDGTLVHRGLIHENHIRQVKGLDYHLKTFLGYDPTAALKNAESDSRLYRCVIYLAPGDYHRFHSPCNWKIMKRTHFYGKLLSVSPNLTKWFPNLLAINERVVYTGEWDYGFFSYTAVGATNVGSIIVYADSNLSTNLRRMQGIDNMKFNAPHVLHSGEEMGYFSMGSSVVLIFEAPKNFRFSYFNQTSIDVGKQLGYFADGSDVDEQDSECENHFFSII